MRIGQARLNGRVQWQAAMKKSGAVAKSLREIAEMERRFTAYLEEGLKGG
jgi:hypothetical protein